MDEDRKEYARQYYKDNKQAISDRKKQRYWSDPEYRRKLRARARSRYRQMLRSPNKLLGYTVKKKDGVPLFTIKHLATVIGKSADFIRAWEKRGIFPTTTYTDKRGWRLYTDAQIRLMEHSIGKWDRKEWTKDQVRFYLHSRWTEGEGNA